MFSVDGQCDCTALFAIRRKLTLVLTSLRYLTNQNAPFELVTRIMKFVDYRLDKTLGRGWDKLFNCLGMHSPLVL